MQGLIAIIVAIAQVAGGATAEQTFEYIGQMPEIMVTAPRYEHEDVAWSGMMPEIVVTATRYEPSADNNNRSFSIEFNGLSNFAYAQEEIDININSPKEHAMGEDLYIPEGDTIDDDVTVSGGNAKIDGVIDGDLAVMGGEVEVNGLIDGDIAVAGGNLDINGTIRGDAAVAGGNVNNRGTIQGDLFLVGGTVALDSGSVIEGDITMIGGTVDRDENATVLGEIESVEVEALQRLLPRISKIFRFPKKLPGAGVFPRIFFIAALIVVYIINLLVFLIFPNAIDRIVEKIQLNVWASVGFGLGIEILYIPLIVLFAVSVIGIPLIPVFVLAVFLGALFGFSALSLIVGERVADGLKWKITNRAGLFSLGWLSIMIIPIIVFLVGPPIFVLGMVVIYVASTIGLGGVIYALIKKNKKGSKK